MIAPTTMITLNEGMSVQDLGENEGAVVLSVATGQLFTCNDTTADVLRAAQQGTSFDTLITRLLGIYEVEEAELRSDIAAILRQLADEGIVRLA